MLNWETLGRLDRKIEIRLIKIGLTFNLGFFAIQYLKFHFNNQ